MVPKLLTKTILVSMLLATSGLAWPTVAHGDPGTEAEGTGESKTAGNGTGPNDSSVGATSTPPRIVVGNVASPPSRPEPGGVFTVDVLVTNTGESPVTITRLTDSVYGDISTQGTCTTAVGTALEASGSTYSCAFSGDFFGNAGARLFHTVVAEAVDGLGRTARDGDVGVFTLTDVAPTVTVENTPTPLSRPEPGGEFTFTVSVTNTSPEQVTITALTDDVYGNVPDQGTCTSAVGTVLDKDGGTYSCSYTGSFSGSAGASQTNTVEVAVIDDDGTSGSDIDETVVELTSATTPTVSISDVSVPEGNAGTTTAVFLLSLSAPHSQSVTLDYTTVDGTATAGTDFAPAAGSVTFAPGQTSESIAIVVTGDTTREPDETYFVRLSGATDGVGFDEEALGTIVDDDSNGTCSKHRRHKGGCSPRCARPRHQNNGQGNAYGWGRCRGNQPRR